MNEAEYTAAVRARQLARAKVLAWVLGAFVVLTFGISIAKMGIH
jgi:hypothetical protein